MSKQKQGGTTHEGRFTHFGAGRPAASCAVAAEKPRERHWRKSAFAASIVLLAIVVGLFVLPLVNPTRQGSQGQLILKAGEVAELDGQRITKVDNANVEDIVAWQTAELAVHGMPLSAVAKALNWYNRRQLRIIDPVAGQIRISGTYKTDHPEEFVLALRQLYPRLRVQETDAGWLVEMKPHEVP
jgi:hypothetical protein